MSLSFHIRHEVRPERMLEVIRCIQDWKPYDHVIQASRQVTRLRQLNLLEDQTLTVAGQSLANLARLEEAVWGEVLHFLHYTTWSEASPTTNGFGWLYRQFTDFLWQAGSAEANTAFLDPLVSFFINLIEEVPSFDQDEMQKAVVSLSPDSLRGALYFLAALNPPVIDGETFSRRHFCKPISVLLATGWVAKNSDAEVGIDMLLTPERREDICRVCLLEPSALDQALDWMLPLYSRIVEPGTTAGIYGRFLRFHKWPELSDFVSPSS